MFSRCPKASMSNEMESPARQVLIRMFVPTVLVGIWTYAQLESVRARQWISMWREGGITRVGNPYTTPVPPERKANTYYDEPADPEIEGIATVDGTF
jgi:hypothetical protein